MKRNASLARFSNTITALALIGILIAFIGGIVFAMADGDITVIVNAVGLLYLGSGLIGLSIFGAFLRTTAAAIVEGLGGNINITESAPIATPSGLGSPATEASSPMGGPDSKTVFKSLSGAELEKAVFKTLYNYQRKDWIDAGSPDLAEWDELGRPDFDKWLESKNS